MTIVVAPDSFKGSLTSIEVATALRAGWLRARPRDTVLLAPLADGGEGTLAAIEAAGGWEWQAADVEDPLRRPIKARWLRSTDGRSAVIEMAEASGLSRVTAEDRDAIRATSVGTGQLIVAALDTGVTNLVVGIGGSATTDGGRGIVEALGGTVVGGDGSDDSVQPRVLIDRLDARLGNVDVRVACDVDNPLLGPHGAAATYAPQKGASREQVSALDETLTVWADALDRASGRDERATAGAGAAGGVGFALLALQDRFRTFALCPGVELVMDATGFADKLARADLVLTGEGRIDAQTAFGKTALGVARRARDAGVGCVAVGGGATPEGIDALAGLAVVVPVTERPQSVEEAMAAGTEPIERSAERIARLISLAEPR